MMKARPRPRFKEEPWERPGRTDECATPVFPETDKVGRAEILISLGFDNPDSARARKYMERIDYVVRSYLRADNRREADEELKVQQRNLQRLKDAVVELQSCLQPSVSSSIHTESDLGLDNEAESKLSLAMGTLLNPTGEVEKRLQVGKRRLNRLLERAIPQLNEATDKALVRCNPRRGPDGHELHALATRLAKIWTGASGKRFSNSWFGYFANKKLDSAPTDAKSTTGKSKLSGRRFIETVLIHARIVEHNDRKVDKYQNLFDQIVREQKNWSKKSQESDDSDRRYWLKH